MFNSIEQIIAEKEYRLKYNKINYYLPDEGALRRDLYPKHVAFLNAGLNHTQRIFMAGNRTGKTRAGAAEMSYHLTGKYPHWWQGRRFTKGIRAWVAGKDGKTTRDILQFELCGNRTDLGSGMIPKEDFIRHTIKPGVSDAFETIIIKHTSGEESSLTFKSYDAGVESFVGTAMDVIWLDEECPYTVYVECLVRTMTTNGIVYITFTPDKGLSETVLSFFANGKVIEGSNKSKFTALVAWDDVPHLTTEAKNTLLETIPPYLRAAKVQGLPYLGSGAIYPVPEDEITVKPFEIPLHWPKVYALDVGWNRTAAVWGALDPETDVIYIYDEYYRSQAEPAIHAHAIKARGEWLSGVIDPASRGRSQIDGRQLRTTYSELGLNLYDAKNAVEAGINSVWQRLSSGKLRIFSHCQNFFSEYRLYRRNEKGEIIKTNDHLMDALRYLIMSGLNHAEPEPRYFDDQNSDSGTYTGRSLVSGY